MVEVGPAVSITIVPWSLRFLLEGILPAASAVCVFPYTSVTDV